MILMISGKDTNLHMEIQSFCSKRISQVKKISELWKFKVGPLRQIINALKDLWQLASEYNIQSRLCNGDGLHYIY